MEPNTCLQDSPTALQDAESTFDILSHGLQPLRETDLLDTCCGLEGWYGYGPPVIPVVYKNPGPCIFFLYYLGWRKGVVMFV